jgi:hypothetical protein
LNKEYKRELKYAAGNLMHLLLRQVVDRSVKVFVEYFEGFKTFKQLAALGEITIRKEILPIVTFIRPISVKAPTPRLTQKRSYEQTPEKK